MSFLSKLHIDGEEFNVLEFEFSVEQSVDESNRPCARPKGGVIEMLIESNTKVDFFEWSKSSSATKDGRIEFYRRDNISSLKKLQFNEAYCIKYTEKFNSIDNEPLKIFLKISAKELTMRGTTLTNNWPLKA
ncbi:type VI secretion system tube protein TssD [Aquimarina algicola]|uniref:Phage tail protein n=1 Tax=Aquimarina algicola TaxID=2589995 RepID=A0A504IY42_9FLAO|nr:type VI secretion system tube protein TssD [Aquimarina algicola]TPN81235.1 hypothetical protein FHK87_24950 [Aquimarina algicola]